VPSSKLIRWGGLAALVAAALFVIADFVILFFAVGQASNAGLLFRSAVAVGAGVLLLLGLVGLYAHQSEATGILGLAAFLAAFIGLALAPQALAWSPLLTNLGWALFGAAAVGARSYPRPAAILLIVGAVLAGLANVLTRGGLVVGTPAVGGGAVMDIALSAAIAWLGFSLFRRRSEEVGHPT
jgi:hypothetical protein